MPKCTRVKTNYREIVVRDLATSNGSEKEEVGIRLRGEARERTCESA